MMMAHVGRVLVGGALLIIFQHAPTRVTINVHGQSHCCRPVACAGLCLGANVLCVHDSKTNGLMSWLGHQTTGHIPVFPHSLFPFSPFACPFLI